MPVDKKHEKYGCGDPRYTDGEELERAIAMAHMDTGMRKLHPGTKLIGGGEVVGEIRGMGKIYDWRPTNWTAANGGTIDLRGHVNHIPVVPNMEGIADFVRLRDVLVAQGLMVHCSTDDDGNVALFVYLDHLCYQARGGNSITCGTEHMHMTVSEDWTKKQLRAAAYIWHRCDSFQDIPFEQTAKVNDGNGYVTITRKGQTTHEAISAHAGYHDRSDPGDKFWDERDYMRHCVRFFREHGHFEGA